MTPNRTRQPHRKKPWAAILIILSVNLLIVGGLALGRLATILETGQSLVAALASTVVLIAAAAGIPYCFEFIASRLRPVMPLLKQRWHARLDLWAAQRRRNAARQRMTRIKDLHTAWHHEAARITAIYTLAYKLAVAKRAQ